MRQVRRHPDARKAIYSVGSVKDRSQCVGCHPHVYDGNAFLDRLSVDVGIDPRQSFKCIIVIAALGYDPIEGFRIAVTPRSIRLVQSGVQGPLTNHPAADEIQPYYLAVLVQLLD